MPTNTQVPGNPTNIPTNKPTNIPTNTQVPGKPTNTPVPTGTPSNTPVPGGEVTPTPTGEVTGIPTPTAEVTETPTPTGEITGTPTGEVTGTPIPTGEITGTPEPSNTVTVSPTGETTATLVPSGSEVIRSGESKEFTLGEGTASVSVETPKAGGASVNVESYSDLPEQIFNEEELSRIRDGETAQIDIQADWIEEEQLGEDVQKAVEEALAGLSTEEGQTGFISGLNVGITKQVGDGAATELSKKDIAAALKGGTSKITVDVSEIKAPKEKNISRYMVVMKDDGTTETVLIPESAKSVTITDGVPVAVVYRKETARSCKFHFAGISLAILLLLAIFLLRNKSGKLTTIVMGAGTAVLLALSLMAGLSRECLIDTVPLGVIALADVILLLKQLKRR